LTKKIAPNLRRKKRMSFWVKFLRGGGVCERHLG